MHGSDVDGLPDCTISSNDLTPLANSGLAVCSRHPWLRGARFARVENGSFQLSDARRARSDEFANGVRRIACTQRACPHREVRNPGALTDLWILPA